MIKKKLKTVLIKANIRRAILLTWSVSKKLTVLTLFLLVLENVLWLGTMYMLKRLVDIVSKTGYADRADELINVVIMAGAISVGYACVKSVSGYFSELQSTKVNHFVDQKIHKHTLSLDYGFYENPEYLDVLKRAREAGMDKPYAVVSGVFDIAKNAIMMGSVSYILISIDWLLLPLLAAFVLPLLISKIFFSNQDFQLYLKNTGLERQAYYLSSLITVDTFAKEIRTFLLGNYIFSKYVKIKDSLIDQRLALSRKRTINELLTTGMATTAFFSVTTYILFGTLSGKTSVGDVAVFLVIFPQSYTIMQALVGAITNLYHNNMFVSNIFKLFDLEPSVECRKSLESFNDGDENGELLIHNVSFKYPSSKEFAIQNVSLKIPAGKIVALVGLNGAGKTTLIKLMCKLYEPTEGSIIFGGHDIKNYSSSQYRKKISVVFQDFVKYNLTVNENIWFGNIHQDPSYDAITKAAIDAGADSFINHFPDKYDTTLGKLFDDGHEISIGQWQKIAIARAFYGDSNLVILDEATSALDAIAEADLFRSFRSRIQNRSALVISHRLSTIKHADFIYVLSNKGITESGTHEELIALKGNYASLYESDSE